MRLRASTRRVALLVTLPVSLVTACATPVGVQRAEPREVHRAITANVLSTGELSNEGAQGLRRNDLLRLFRRDPKAALGELHERIVADPVPRDVFALSEASFYHAERGGGQPYYLAAALHAWAFLFHPDPELQIHPLDARVRLAADLYNRGITAGLQDERGLVDLSPRTLELPFGQLTIESHPETFVWADHRLREFIPAAEIEVLGLAERHRRTGIGAPLAARIGERVMDNEVSDPWLGENLIVTSTALLRFEAVREQIRQGDVRATLELYLAGTQQTTEINGREVPLESEPTASLALLMAEDRLWDRELAAFLGEPVELQERNNLIMLTPHQRGRVPLVLVHGTVSSPARWGETMNEVWNDPRLNERYELWLFFYNTGQPILYSASELRHALRDAFEALDPDGSDPGIQNAVIVGHSQGGLLTRLQVIDSGDAFWRTLSDVPLEDLELDDETRALLDRTMFFEAQPQLRRAVFMATPHRGSFVAGSRRVGLASHLVRMPVRLGRASADLFRSDDPEAEARRKIDRLPTSTDDMSPGAPFLRAVQERPFHPRVTVHSIIAVTDEDDPPEGQDDHVVDYESAHLEEAASEKVVISDHSVQRHPDAVAELRRILLLHLNERDPRREGGDGDAQ